MWIFDKTPNGFRLNENDDPPKPKNITADGPWYLRAATNPFNADSDPLAGYGELFVRVCGKVYLTFTGWATGPSREAYIWENGATTDACNREWIDYNRDVFQQLYKAKRYAEAVRFLQGPLDQCGKRIDAKQRAWSYNDLALADFRLGRSPKLSGRCREGEVADAGVSAQSLTRESDRVQRVTLQIRADAGESGLRCVLQRCQPEQSKFGVARGVRESDTSGDRA